MIPTRLVQAAIRYGYTLVDSQRTVTSTLASNIKLPFKVCTLHPLQLATYGIKTTYAEAELAHIAMWCAHQSGQDAVQLHATADLMGVFHDMGLSAIRAEHTYVTIGKTTFCTITRSDTVIKTHTTPVVTLEIVHVPVLLTVPTAYVVSLCGVPVGIHIAEQLRSAGLIVDVDLNGRGISKNLQHAKSLGIPFVLIIGDAERENNTVMVKSMHTQTQQHVAVDALVAFLQTQTIQKG